MRRIRVAVVAGAAVAALAAAGWFAWTRYASPEAKALQSVKDHLNDAESARFKELEYHPETGGLCGLVNAKNRMGAYVGFTVFAKAPGKKIAFEPDGDTNDRDVDRRIKALQERIEFLKAFEEACPQKAASAASR